MRKELFILSLALLAGCSKEQPASLVTSYEEDELVPCEVSFETKGSGAGDYTDTTFRAQLFYRGGSSTQFTRFDSLITPYSGTYCKPKGSNTWLTPCSVDADGKFLAEGAAFGLRAGKNHDYYLFLSTPAVQYIHYADTVKINTATGTGYNMEWWGLPYSRGGVAKDHPSVSPGAKVTTTGVNLQGTYKYSLSDTMKLIEYRSRMAFSVRCGDAISHVRFKGLTISELRKEAVYRPFTRDFYFVEDPANYESVTVYQCPSAQGIYLERNEVSTGVYEPGESQSLTGPSTNEHLDDYSTNTNFAYILSDDYKSLDFNNLYIRTPCNLNISLVSDLGLPITMEPIPLPFIFEPQKSYYYLITINSIYLTITVYSRNWSDPIVNDCSIEDPNPMTITVSIKDWTQYTSATAIEPGGGGGGGGTTTTTTGTNLTASDWNTYNTGNSVVD